MPKEGYTPLVESILNHENISLTLGCRFDKNPQTHIIMYSTAVRWMRTLIINTGTWPIEHWILKNSAVMVITKVQRS